MKPLSVKLGSGKSGSGKSDANANGRIESRSDETPSGRSASRSDAPSNSRSLILTSLRTSIEKSFLQKSLRQSLRHSLPSPFRRFIFNPFRAGAITPSSRSLARRMVRDLDLTTPKVVVELGSGTGVFTDELVRMMGDRGQLILVERSQALADLLQKRFPRAIVICDCVSTLGKHLDSLGIREVDYIVSGLPWTVFPQELQDRALEQVLGALRPGGIFVTFIYLHGMRFFNIGVKFEQKLRSRLGPIEKSEPIWRNLPPARVWTWRRPLLLEAARTRYLH